MLVSAAMKSVVLIVWLALASGHEEVVHTGHYDDMAACEATARAVAGQYAQRGKTRHLCHGVVEELGGVDADGNPIGDE